MAPAKRKRKRPTRAERADKHVLYERAVQCVEAEIDFIDATYASVRGRRAQSLREDFCGTANTSCEWVRRRRMNRAIGVDLDADTLAWSRGHHIAALKPSARKRITLLQANVLDVASGPVDVVLAMNFSYFIFKQRDLLRAYFRSVYDTLVDDGILFLDAFGGYDAFRVLKETTSHGDFDYIWDQAAYNAVTGEIRCYIHFRFRDGSRLKQAFTYDWRLWTLAEIREVLEAAGFSRVTTYFEGWDEDEGSGNGEFTPAAVVDPDAGWLAYISAEK